MSANIYWQPIEKKRYDLSVGAPSSFMESLEGAFNQMPIILEDDEETFAVLRGMIASTRGEYRERYKQIREALHRYRKIRIWAEY